MKRRFLPRLGEAAILASTARSSSHQPAQFDRNGVHPQSPSLLVRPLGSQSQKGKHFRELDQSFGFPALDARQPSQTTLLVEQFLEAIVHASWKAELLQTSRHFQLDDDGSRHLDQLPNSNSRTPTRTILHEMTEWFHVGDRVDAPPLLQVALIVLMTMFHESPSKAGTPVRPPRS